MDNGLTLSALARTLKRAKSGLHRLKERGQIPQLPNGRYNLAAVQAALKANLDPAKKRGAHRFVHATVHQDHRLDGRTVGEALTHQFDVGAVWGMEEICYRMGAAAAAAAVRCGALLQTAYCLERSIRADAARLVLSVITESGVKADDFEEHELACWDSEEFHKVDWAELAKEAGEPLDLAGWEAYWQTLPQALKAEGEPAA